VAEVLLLLAAIILAAVAAGLWRVLRGPAPADKLMAAQLLCTGGIAVLLIFGAATRAAGLADVALVMALLSAFATVAFVLAARMLDDR
jgi:multicomponent Na+:H+ antiporter subunit F